jgi:hypothetical protein
MKMLVDKGVMIVKITSLLHQAFVLMHGIALLE